eukprot:scaffold296558_cov21-Tisochrysis_lutea.AAC.1
MNTASACLWSAYGLVRKIGIRSFNVMRELAPKSEWRPVTCKPLPAMKVKDILEEAAQSTRYVCTELTASLAANPGAQALADAYIYIPNTIGLGLSGTLMSLACIFPSKQRHVSPQQHAGTHEQDDNSDRAQKHGAWCVLYF